jgi:hypothetical protein
MVQGRRRDDDTTIRIILLLLIIIIIKVAQEDRQRRPTNHKTKCNQNRPKKLPTKFKILLLSRADVHFLSHCSRRSHRNRKQSPTVAWGKSPTRGRGWPGNKSGRWPFNRPAPLPFLTASGHKSSTNHCLIRNNNVRPTTPPARLLLQ